MPGLGLAVNRTRVTIFRLQALVFIILFGLIGFWPVSASFIEIAVANNSYPTVTVTAESGGQQGLEDGEVFVPPATEDFVYHDDGNVLYDGRWEYTWDAENQLIVMESLSPAPTGSERRLEFDYDYLGRQLGMELTTLTANEICMPLLRVPNLR